MIRFVGLALLLLGVLYIGLKPNNSSKILDNIGKSAVIALDPNNESNTDESFRVIDGAQQKVPFRVPAGGVVTLLIKGTVMLQNSRKHCLNVSPDYAVTQAYSEDGLTYFVTPKSEQQEKIEVTSLREGEDNCGSK